MFLYGLFNVNWVRFGLKVLNNSIVSVCFAGSERDIDLTLEL